jgi:hypothetical protein
MSTVTSESRYGALNWKICRTMLHDVAPVFFAYVPGSQLMQVLRPTAEYVPALQAEQVAEDVLPEVRPRPNKDIP